MVCFGDSSVVFLFFWEGADLWVLTTSPTPSAAGVHGGRGCHVLLALERKGIPPCLALVVLVSTKMHCLQHLKQVYIDALLK